MPLRPPLALIVHIASVAALAIFSGACTLVPTPTKNPAMNSAPLHLAAVVAPSGTLRAAINFGNPILATKDAATSEPRGVSVDLARELGRRLGVPVQLVPYTAAGKVVEGLKAGEWDVGFVAIDHRLRRLSADRPTIAPQTRNLPDLKTGSCQYLQFTHGRIASGRRHALAEEWTKHHAFPTCQPLGCRQRIGHRADFTGIAAHQITQQTGREQTIGHSPTEPVVEQLFLQCAQIARGIGLGRNLRG